MAKLRKLISESKYLKREFGEPLPTFNGVMKKHKINKLKEDWWDDLGPAGQAQYLKDNPGSKKAQDAEKDDSDMGDTAADPFSRDYDADKHGESPHDKYDDNWGDEFDEPKDDKPKFSQADLDAMASTQHGTNQVRQSDYDQFQSGGAPAFSADDEADDMKWDDAQDSRDAEDRKDAGIKPIKADADTKRMGDSIQRKIGGSKDPDRLELQGTQEASNGETIIQFKDKEDGMMVGVDAQGNIYEDGDKQAYGVDVSTESDVFGDDQNAQLLYKQKRARETGGTDPYTGEKYPKPARTGKELSRREAKQFIRRNKMKISEDIIRKVIRQEIKSIMKEDDEAFSQPIPATIERFMKKFIGAMEQKNLNRKRKLAILGRVIVALRLEPSEVSKYARLVKREL
jgi:hypothetical protein